MIAIVQFDCVSLPHFHHLLEANRLPAFASLQKRGHWVSLQTPALSWEGATYFTLYSGKQHTEHGVYYPFMWSAADQRVRPQDDYPAPEPVWDRLGKSGRRALVIDPYEGRSARSIEGKALCGWQFTHKVTLRKWSVPRGLDRQFERQFGRPALVEEVYGRPSAHYLLKMRNRLLGAPRRAAEVAEALLSEERFDLVWITLSSGHIAGHWFLDPSRLPLDELAPGLKTELNTTLADAYAGIDEALSRILAALPSGSDLIVLSPSSMGPSASRTHLMPGMLKAILAERRTPDNATKPAGSFLWRLRAAVPPDFRAWVARVLPDRLTMELTARLDMRGTDWSKTRAFMVPSGDCGYVRLNLRGRERDGIVKPEEGEKLLERIVSGLRTFRDPDGEPAVKHIDSASTSLGTGTQLHHFPDLIVHWSDRLPPHLAGVCSSEFGDVASPGWGSGRTGEHRDDAWALILPATSKLAVPITAPHIIDIAPTVCRVLGVETEDLPGQSLLEPLANHTE